MRVRPQAAGQKYDPGLQKVIGRGQKKIVYTWSYIMDYLGRDILSVIPAVYIVWLVFFPATCPCMARRGLRISSVTATVLSGCHPYIEMRRYSIQPRKTSRGHERFWHQAKGKLNVID